MKLIIPPGAGKPLAPYSPGALMEIATVAHIAG